jgi:hypothetical protein
MQDRPVCFRCKDVIEHSTVFEAPCGADHDRCPSAAFHGLCLMEWREYWTEFIKRIEAIKEAWIQEHDR